MERSKTTERDQCNNMDRVHYAIGCLYLIILLFLTIVWNSVSLIVLTGAHVFLIIIYMMIHHTTDTVENGALKIIVEMVFPQSQKNANANQFMGIMSWHIHNSNHNWVNLIHIIVLMTNLLFFLDFTYNDLTPSTIKLPAQVIFHHFSPYFGVYFFDTLHIPSLLTYRLY